MKDLLSLRQLSSRCSSGRIHASSGIASGICEPPIATTLHVGASFRHDALSGFRVG